jgi:hypothetical protein
MGFGRVIDSGGRDSIEKHARLSHYIPITRGYSCAQAESVRTSRHCKFHPQIREQGLGVAVIATGSWNPPGTADIKVVTSQGLRRAIGLSLSTLLGKLR